jgi:His-Xaa-Ser system radical SAM maturase HxsC
MLPLQGRATLIRGFGGDGAPSALRLRSPKAKPACPEDVAIVHDLDAFGEAVANGFSAVVLVADGHGEPSSAATAAAEQLLVLPSSFGYLADGDIIGVRWPAGQVRTLYRRSSRHNWFLVTERCNHYCLMCSQPPKNVDDAWIVDQIKCALRLIEPDTPSIGFTGGEPLLDWQLFLPVLAQARDYLPSTAVHVLSNGRAFADSSIVDAWADLAHPNLSAGIPVYAAIDHIHDYVVQARGAFDETILGILKLKDRGQRVEVRLVLHAITAPRLVETCTWFARNLPFVDHFALMGLENTGFAIANDAALWIDPVDYRKTLADAVAVMVAANLNVSIYNLQRCVLDASIWPYAVRSISDWKNEYLDACNDCIEKDRCAGFFGSGRPRHSRAIQALR